MVTAFSKALLYYTLPIFCFIVSGLSHISLRQDLSHAVKGSEKLNTVTFPSIADQLKKLNHIRNPRQIDSGRLHEEHSDVWVVQGFKNFRGCPKAAYQFKVFQNAEDWYAIIATNALENNTEIYTFTELNGCGKLLETLPTRQAFDFEVVHTNDVIRIVVLEKTPTKYPHKRSGSSVYTVNLASNVTISAIRREVLRSEEPTCITTWEQYGIPHVAICNGKSRDFRGIESYWAKSYIYCASGGYFDKCGEIETHFPKAIRHFRIFSKHYLAVANYPNETVAEDVPTEILRYDLGSKRFQQLQLLPTKGASDLCFLDIGTGLNTLHFLVVVNRLAFGSTGKATYDVTSHVYKFVGEKFEPLQSISLDSKTTGCLAYQADNGKSALMFSTSWGVNVYQYNGWRFVSVAQYSSFALGSGINTFTTLKMNNETFITVANSNPGKSDNDNLFSPKFSRQLNATLSTVYTKSMSTCRQMRTELEVDPTRLIIDLYPRAVKKNDTVIQLGKVDFNSLSADRVWTNQVVLKTNTSKLGATQIIQLKRLNTKVEQLGQKLQALTKRFKQAMQINGDHILYGNVHFKSLVSTCQSSDKLSEGCVFGNVSAKTVNSVDVTDTYQQAIINTDKSIPSLKTRRLELLNSHPIKTTSLSGRGIKEYLTVSEDLKFQDKIRIEGNLVVNGLLSVKGLVDEHEISPTTLLLRQGIQHLNWTLKTTDAHLKKLKAHFVNGKNISHLYQNAISNAGNFTLLQPKFFSSLSASNLNISGLINGINLTNLKNGSMKLAGAQVVTGIHGYLTANLGRAILNGSLNGKQFPQDFVSVRENDRLKLKKLQLTQDTAMARLTITESIDGMRVTNGSWGTNLFNKSNHQNQVVTGKKRFENLKSSGVVFSKTFNQRSMDVFATNSSLYGNSEELLIYDSVTVQGNVTFEKPLSVNDTESIGLQMLEGNGILLSTKNFPPLGSITFKDNIKINGDLSLVTLDGVPSSDFLTRDRKIPFNFNGRKEFSNPVSMNHTFTLLYTLNGYDLRDLWKRSLKIEGDQMLSGSLIIKNDVDVFKIKAQNSQLVSLTSPSVLTGIKHFQNLVIEGNWFVDTLDVAGLFNDVDVSSWQNDTVLKTGKRQTIISQKSLISLTSQNAEIVAIDDIDIKRLLDVVLVHQPATLYSDIMLNGTVFSNEVLVNGSIDGVNSNAPLSWLRYGVNQNLSGNVEVRRSLDVGDFQQDSWMVNAVNLNALLEDTVRITDVKEFSSLRFDHIVTVDLKIEGLIQGHNVTKELFLKNSDDHRTITGVKSFSGPLVSDSLRVVKDLNGVDPKQVCQKPIPPQPSNWIVYGNVLMKRDTKLNTSKVNDRLLDEITRHLWLKDVKVEMKPKQSFKDVIMNGVLSERNISNFNFSDLSRRSVKLSPFSEQRITALHRFQSLKARSIIVESLNSSRINDIDVTHISHGVLLRDTEQNISNHIKFQDVIATNVTLSGLLNRVDVNVSLMRIDRNSVITGKKSVKTLLVHGSIDVCNNCSVGTFDISNWASRAVLRKGNFTLSGAKFDSMLFQQPLNLNGTLNNVTVNQDAVLTLSDQQEINGRLSLSSLLPDNMLYSSELGPFYQQSTEGFKVAGQFANLQINGLYDGISLSHFYDQLVQRNTSVVFSEPVVLSSLIARRLQDSSSNSTIGDIITLPLNASHHIAISPSIPQETRQLSLSSLVQKIKRVVSRQSAELRFFEEMALPGTLPPAADYVYAWETKDGKVELCSYDEAQGELFYGSSTSPLLKGVELSGVAYLKATEDFAVAALNRSSSLQQNHDSYIFSPKSSSKLEKQTIPTQVPIGAAAFLISNSSCYLFLELTSESTIYCRSLGSNVTYTLFQRLPIADGRLVTVGYHYHTGLPLLTIASMAQRGYGHITVWSFDVTSNQFQPWKTIVTLQIIALDCVCNEVQCLLVTVAPAKPAAIPGQVIVWSLNDFGPPTRLQRITFSEPIDAKFTRLPDGRLTLMVLQINGVDNVSVYVWRGLLQFQHETTVRVPGAKFLQLISNDVKLMIALTVTSPIVTELPYGPLRMFRAQFVGQLN